MKAFLSVGVVNEVQAAGAEKIYTSLEEAGIQVLPEKTDEHGPSLSHRLELIRQADVVVCWLDFLLDEGVEFRVIGGRQQQIMVPFPPPLQALIDKAALESGQGIPTLSSKRQKILLPGQVDQVANTPKGIPVQFQNNVAVCQLLSPPMNVPHVVSTYEAGIARGLGKPIVLIQFAPSLATGILGEDTGMIVLRSFEEVEDWALVLVGKPPKAREPKKLVEEEPKS